MWSYEHDGFTVHQLAVLNDNYIYLIDAAESDFLAAVDPATSEDVAAACTHMGRRLTHILNTHHHWDHIGGNLELKQRFDCQIVGAAHDAERIPGIDMLAREGEPLILGDLAFHILDVRGHTRGHIAYLLGDALFCGDTLFGAGCGRLFEGTADQMWQSLNKIMQLDDSTKFYCAHEYTENNLMFALEMDSDNVALQARMRDVRQRCRHDMPTIPGTLAEERATNPFLRPLDAAF
ncbi:MAG: hydroxyacylglutathione hydrolase, partial [Mariprofundaceae bacterium]